MCKGSWVITWIVLTLLYRTEQCALSVLVTHTLGLGSICVCHQWASQALGLFPGRYKHMYVLYRPLAAHWLQYPHTETH